MIISDGGVRRLGPATGRGRIRAAAGGGRSRDRRHGRGLRRSRCAAAPLQAAAVCQ
jgi:hypothetical protein